jgi:acetylornithine/succinyldiaminopimelate/putrescine aminotransferase
MDIKQTADRVIANTYARYPLALVKGRGCTVWDDQGKAYTDFWPASPCATWATPILNWSRP